MIRFSSDRLSTWSAGLGRSQHRQERFLRDLDAADALHACLAGLLLLEELALARDVPAVALRQHVLAHRADGLTSNDVRANGRLYGHLEHLARDQLLEPVHEHATFTLGARPMCDQGQRIDRLAGNKHIEAHEVTLAIADLLVVHRRVTLAAALELIVE